VPSAALFASNFGDDSRLRPASLYDVSYGSDQCGSLNHIGDEGRMVAGGLGSLLGILQKPIFKTGGNFEFIIGHGLFAISVITVELRASVSSVRFAFGSYNRSKSVVRCWRYVRRKFKRKPRQGGAEGAKESGDRHKPHLS
jgi:hypothetical protein